MNVNKLGQQILQSLCQHIVYGDLPQNGKLPSIRQMADQYKASTVIIREAVIVLETLGIVRIEHGKGVFLVQPENLIDQLFDTRRALESILIQGAVENMSDADLSFLKEHVEGMERAARPPASTSEYGTHDSLFHERIIALSPNFIAGKFLSMIRSAVYTPGIYRTNMMAKDPDYFVKSNSFHWEIYHALEARDAERAVKASKAHEERVRAGWQRNLETWREEHGERSSKTGL